MKIEELYKDDRPRERLIKKGANSLSDVELLAIMLGSGSKEESVIDLSKRLINDYGLNKLLKMNYQELNQIKGIKEAKATKLMACFELAKRSQITIKKNKSLLNSKDLYDFFNPFYLFKSTEVFSIIFADVKCRVIEYEELTIGDVASVELPIRTIISKCLTLNCYSVFLCHNHPSGDIKPSKSDISSTKILQRSLKDIGVLLLDHIIIGKDNFYSFSDDELL